MTMCQTIWFLEIWTLWSYDMEDINNKTMMDIINRRRQLTSEYLINKLQRGLKSSTPKPNVARDTNRTNVASRGIINSKEDGPSTSSNWEPSLQAHTPVSSSSIQSSKESTRSSDGSTPEVSLQPGPRWWQREHGKSLQINMDSPSKYEHQEYSRYSPPGRSLTSSTGRNLQLIDTTRRHSTITGNQFPSLGHANPSDSREGWNSQGIIRTPGSSKVNDRNSQSLGRVRPSEIVKELKRLNVQESSESGSLSKNDNSLPFPSTPSEIVKGLKRLNVQKSSESGSLSKNDNSLPFPPTARASSPKEHDGKGEFRNRSEVIDKARERQQFYVVPPPRRRVPLSEYYVGESVIIRKNRHVWLLASITSLSNKGLKVWVQESRVFVNIPPELLYTHLRKVDDDLEYLFPMGRVQGSQKDDNQRLFLNDKDLQQHSNGSSALSSSGLCPVNLVRPAHLAHRRLYQPPKLLSCAICYEGMSTVEAHFPWECNHGSHLPCLEMKLQTSSFGSAFEAYCPTCKDNIAKSEKLELLKKSSFGSLVGTSNFKGSLEGIRPTGIRANQDTKFEEIDRKRWNQPSSKSTTTTEIDNNFQVSDWIAIQCNCGFRGVVRKNKQLGMPPVCPACRDHVTISWIPSEEVLIKALSYESPPITPKPRSLPDNALLSQTPSSHLVHQTIHSREIGVRPSREGFMRDNSSHMPPTCETAAGPLSVGQYKDVDSSTSKHVYGSTSAPVANPLETKGQDSPNSSKAFFSTRGIEIGETDKPTTSNYSKEDKVVADQLPAKTTSTTTTTKDASVGVQHDFNALGALGMPKWSSRGKGKGKTTLPTDSLSFYITPSLVKEKMEFEPPGKPSISVEIDDGSLSKQSILEEDIDEECIDMGLSFGGHTEKLEETQPSTSRTDLGPLGMPKWSLREKGKATMPTDSLAFYIKPSDIKQKMEELELGGKTLMSVEINKKPLSTQSILEHDFDHNSPETHLSINVDKEKLHDKSRTREYIKEGEVLADRLPSKRTTTKDASVGSQHDLTSIGALGMPKWSSRAKGKGNMPTDSLSFYVTPLQIKHKMEEFEARGKAFISAEMESGPLSTQSILEDDCDPDSTDEDSPMVEHRERRREEVQPSTTSNVEFGLLADTVAEEDTFGEFIFTPPNQGFQLIPPTTTATRGYEVPSDSVSAYRTQKQIKQQEQKVNNIPRANDKRPALPPGPPPRKTKSKPSDPGRGLSTTRLPTDSLSFYITPLQIKKQLEKLDKWSNDFDAAEALNVEGKPSIEWTFTVDEEEEDDIMQKQPSPSSEITAYTTSPPYYVQPNSSLQTARASGSSTSKKPALPVDSLSFYITPALVKEQMAQLQEREEGKALNEDLDVQDLSEMPSVPTEDNDNTVDNQSQTEDLALSFSKLLAPLRVIPENEAISTDESSTPSSPESQPSSSEPTSLATRLKRMKLRKSKSAPSTPSQAPASNIRRTTSWSAPSTPPEGTAYIFGLENDPSIQWITVRRT